jgi:PII-like signaling protein
MTKLSGEQMLMRIFIGEGDRYKHTPLYEALMELLRIEGIAGATVLRGVCGFGANRVYHTQKLLDLSAKLPLVIEAVDCPDKINAIMPKIDAMMGGGMITLEKVTVIRYSSTAVVCDAEQCSCVGHTNENGE